MRRAPRHRPAHGGFRRRASAALRANPRRRPRPSPSRASCSTARASPEALRQQRRDQPLAVGTLLLQRLDEEPEPAQRLGEKLEVFVADRRVRVRVAVDLLFAKPRAGDRRRPAPASGTRRESGGCPCSSVAISERFVVSRKNASSTCSIRRRLTWISRATCASSTRSCARRKMSSISAAGAGRDRTRFARRVEPREHRRDLLREIARKAAVVRDGAFGEQYAGRVLHREHFGHVARRRHRVETARRATPRAR